jgi:hypothetical protein
MQAPQRSSFTNRSESLANAVGGEVQHRGVLQQEDHRNLPGRHVRLVKVWLADHRVRDPFGIEKPVGGLHVRAAAGLLGNAAAGVASHHRRQLHQAACPAAIAKICRGKLRSGPLFPVRQRQCVFHDRDLKARTDSTPQHPCRGGKSVRALIIDNEMWVTARCGDGGGRWIG